MKYAAYLLSLLVLWQPIMMTVMLFWHKIVRKDDYLFATYVGNLKAWFIQLWDLIKYRSLT